MTRLMAWVRSVWLPLLVVLALGGLVVARVMQATAEREAVPTVEQIREERGLPVAIAVAERGALEVWRELSGNVSGTREAVVRARTGDQVSDVPVAVGDPVRQGQVLVRQAGEAAAARVRQAETALRQAERRVERLRPLHEAGAISEQEWEAALTDLELASEELAAARDPMTLTSPLAGVVTEVLARPGMIPDTGDPLLRVADLSGLVVSLRVSAAQAAEIRQGQAARIPGRDVDGEVRRVALQADPATRLVEVEVAFPPEAGLILGTLATVEVRTASREETTIVPRAAVRDAAAWVVDEEQRATRRSVTVGLQARDRTEILSGVVPGERVVVEGASLLSEGARVRVLNAGVEELAQN